jgi:predicted dehydrogenase
MSSTPIRSAVLGYGLAGRVFHCPFVSAVPGFELTTILQRTGNTAADAYPHARIIRDPEDAFADPSIDLIIIATPNETHTELATRALNAGKHVVVDKPLAPTSADARTLIDLAAKKGLILAPFHNRRFDGDFLTVRKLLREGTLGRVVQIYSRFDRFRPIQRPGTWKETGGQPNGILYDLGPHLLDQAVALFGLPDRITAEDREERDKTDIDDAFNVTLHFDNPSFEGKPIGRPVRYTCEATLLAAEPSPRFTVHGTNGTYTKRGVDPQEPAINTGGARPPQLGSPELWFPEPQSAWGNLTVCTKPTEPVELSTKPFPTETGDYRLFYANVRDAIRGESALAVPSEAGYINLRLLELAVESSKSRRTLDVTL